MAIADQPPIASTEETIRDIVKTPPKKKGTRNPIVRALLMVIRRSHLYFGLLLVPWAILYGVTAYLFNHPTHFSSVFLNPGAANFDGDTVVTNNSNVVLARFGRSHYVGNCGQDEPWGYSPPVQDWRRLATGPLYRNSRVRIAEVSDGLSNTVFVGEHTTISDKTWVGVVPGSFSCPKDPLRFPFTECDHGSTYVLCHSGPAADEPGIIHSPSFPTCHVCQMYAPWSGGGGYVLLGDGSVRYIATTINLDTWAAMSSCGKGEVFAHED